MHPIRKVALGAFALGLAGVTAVSVTSLASASSSPSAAVATTIVSGDSGGTSTSDSTSASTSDTSAGTSDSGAVPGGDSATTPPDGSAGAPALPDGDGDGGRGPGGHGGPGAGGQGAGGPHMANGITEVELTGDEASSVQAAVQAAYPDATIDRMETDAEGAAFEAHITNADGTHSTVKLDASFAITSTEDGMA